ncbi:uncharacterized protein UDID_17054 [Ustilago sp. UG-2017a]|nr:uncharacterized protein UDID_17054 [Ustilago sp. UG-2017a]
MSESTSCSPPQTMCTEACFTEYPSSKAYLPNSTATTLAATYRLQKEKSGCQAGFTSQKFWIERRAGWSEDGRQA